MPSAHDRGLPRGFVLRRAIEAAARRSSLFGGRGAGGSLGSAVLLSSFCMSVVSYRTCPETAGRRLIKSVLRADRGRAGTPNFGHFYSRRFGFLRPLDVQSSEVCGDASGDDFRDVVV